ncbi:unnamed protein product [Prunus armeniaca]
MEARKLLNDKKFWFASVLIAWAAALQGHMMWVKRQDSFKQKFGNLSEANTNDADQLIGNSPAPGATLFWGWNCRHGAGQGVMMKEQIRNNKFLTHELMVSCDIENYHPDQTQLLKCLHGTWKKHSEAHLPNSSSQTPTGSVLLMRMGQWASQLELLTREANTSSRNCDMGFVLHFISFLLGDLRRSQPVKPVMHDELTLPTLF